MLYLLFVHSDLPNYRSGKAHLQPAQEVRAAVPTAGHVQVPGDQGAAGAHTGIRGGHQENDDPGRDGATHPVDHVAVLPEPQLSWLRRRELDGRRSGRANRTGGRVRPAHRRHVGRLFHVRATGVRVSAERRLPGLLQEPDGRREGQHVLMARAAGQCRIITPRCVINCERQNDQPNIIIILYFLYVYH